MILLYLFLFLSICMAGTVKTKFNSAYPVVLSAQFSSDDRYSDIYTVKIAPEISEVGDGEPASGWVKNKGIPAERLRLMKIDRRNGAKFHFGDGMIHRPGTCLALDADKKLVVRPKRLVSNCLTRISLKPAKDQREDRYEVMIVTLRLPYKKYLLCPIEAGINYTARKNRKQKNDNRRQKRRKIKNIGQNQKQKTVNIAQERKGKSNNIGQIQKQKIDNIGQERERKPTKHQSKQIYQSPDVIYHYDIQVVPNDTGSRLCENTRFPRGITLLLKNASENPVPSDDGDPSRLASEIDQHEPDMASASVLPQETGQIRFMLMHASIIYVSFTELVRGERQYSYYYALVGRKGIKTPHRLVFHKMNASRATKFVVDNSTIVTHTNKCLGFDTDQYLTIIESSSNKDSGINRSIDQSKDDTELQCLAYEQLSESDRADFNTPRVYEEKIVEVTKIGYILCPRTLDSVDSFSIEKVPMVSSSGKSSCDDPRSPNGLKLRIRNTRVKNRRALVPSILGSEVAQQHGGKRKSNGEVGIPLDKHHDNRNTRVTQLQSVGVLPYRSEYRGMLSADLLESRSQNTGRTGHPAYSVNVGINNNKGRSRLTLVNTAQHTSTEFHFMSGMIMYGAGDTQCLGLDHENYLVVLDPKSEENHGLDCLREISINPGKPTNLNKGEQIGEYSNPGDMIVNIPFKESVLCQIKEDQEPDTISRIYIAIIIGRNDSSSCGGQKMSDGVVLVLRNTPSPSSRPSLGMHPSESNLPPKKRKTQDLAPWMTRTPIIHGDPIDRMDSGLVDQSNRDISHDATTMAPSWRCDSSAITGLQCNDMLSSRESTGQTTIDGRIGNISGTKNSQFMLNLFGPTSDDELGI